MTFLETPRFPDRISANMEGGPTWATRVVILKSGYEQRNIEWDAARMRFNIATAINSAADLAEVIAWMRALRGRAHGFRIKDPLDYSATTAEGYVGTGGVGDGLPTGQMIKFYEIGALSEARPITKPVAGTVTFYYDGAVLAPASLDTATGIVSWTALDSASVVNATPATGDATTVELADALSGAQVGDKMYLSSISGTIGATLNDTAHTIQGISGSPTVLYDLAVSTDGLSYTSGGTGGLYPQASKTLRWAGEFDVPARFGTDTMQLMAKTTTFQRWNDLPILEIRV